jgi:hypothetical protein
MPKHRGIIVSGLVLALAAFGPASALAKAGGSDRPWKSSATATSTLDLVSLTATSMGTGHATHVGKTPSLNDYESAALTN